MIDQDNVRMSQLIETTRGLRDIIFDQTRQIDDCLNVILLDREGVSTLPSGDADVLKIITTMIHMVGISGHSLLKLTEEIDLKVRDAFPIARAIIEGVVNVCYIMAVGPEAAQKAWRHAEVKSYRDLQRVWEVGGQTVAVEHMGKISPADVARLESMLPEFTTKRGAERDWTDLTLRQRMDKIADFVPSQTMVMLNASAFGIYRHASEVIHGSYFAACYFWGKTSPASAKVMSKEAAVAILAEHQFTVLVLTVFAYVGLLESFAKYVNLPRFADISQEMLKKMRQLPAVVEVMD